MKTHMNMAYQLLERIEKGQGGEIQDTELAARLEKLVADGFIQEAQEFEESSYTDSEINNFELTGKGYELMERLEIEGMEKEREAAREKRQDMISVISLVISFCALAVSIVAQFIRF